MQGISEVIKDYNPVALKAKAVKVLAYTGVLAILLSLSFCSGHRVAVSDCKRDAYKEAAHAQEQRADNAVDAGKRFGDYTKTQAELDAAVAAAKSEVAAYYEANPQQPRVVEKTKLVTVPGKEELVYVPIGTCPNDLFGSDELRLFNKGNKRTDLSHP